MFDISKQAENCQKNVSDDVIQNNVQHFSISVSSERQPLNRNTNAVEPTENVVQNEYENEIQYNLDDHHNNNDDSNSESFSSPTNLNENITKFVLKLYGDMSLTRKHAIEIISSVQNMILNPLIDKKESVSLDGVENLKSKISSLKEIINEFSSEY